ncbi:hypothetical protein Bbelb_056410 [Branchiostoma belcheri]|nr:hypothetical protein Bbelb_056410 [Branchiostoma belcheri]
MTSTNGGPVVASVAQRLERWTRNREVPGSILTVVRRCALGKGTLHDFPTMYAAPIDALYGGLLPGSLGTKRAAPIDSIYGGLGLPISGKRAPHPNDSIDKDPPVMAERSAAPIDAILGGRGLPMSYKRAVAPIDSLIGGHGLSITGKRRAMALPIDNIIGGYGLPISVRVGNKDRQRGAESENDEATWLQSIW